MFIVYRYPELILSLTDLNYLLLPLRDEGTCNPFNATRFGNWEGLAGDALAPMVSSSLVPGPGVSFSRIEGPGSSQATHSREPQSVMGSPSQTNSIRRPKGDNQSCFCPFPAPFLPRYVNNVFRPSLFHHPAIPSRVQNVFTSKSIQVDANLEVRIYVLFIV